MVCTETTSRTGLYLFLALLTSGTWLFFASGCGPDDSPSGQGTDTETDTADRDAEHDECKNFPKHLACYLGSSLGYIYLGSGTLTPGDTPWVTLIGDAGTKLEGGWFVEVTDDTEIAAYDYFANSVCMGGCTWGCLPGESACLGVDKGELRSLSCIAGDTVDECQERLQ